jgi:hypothetical protein
MAQDCEQCKVGHSGTLSCMPQRASDCGRSTGRRAPPLGRSLASVRGPQASAGHREEQQPRNSCVERDVPNVMLVIGHKLQRSPG